MKSFVFFSPVLWLLVKILQHLEWYQASSIIKQRIFLCIFRIRFPKVDHFLGYSIYHRLYICFIFLDVSCCQFLSEFNLIRNSRRLFETGKIDSRCLVRAHYSQDSRSREIPTIPPVDFESFICNCSEAMPVETALKYDSENESEMQ